MSTTPTTFVGAIDQGTTSSRFLVFNDKREIVASSQMEHQQITPAPGFLEHNPEEIFQNVCTCAERAMKDFRAKFPEGELSAVGITNQRETTVAWDNRTGKSLANAIVWSDNRTAGVMKDVIAENGGNADCFRESCGLPVSTYFSATKMRWFIENVQEVKSAVEGGYCSFGTVDAWLIYHLTNKQVFVCDVTNASRTMLMDLKSLKWNENTCSKFGIPMKCLPKIVSSSEVVGNISADLPTTGAGEKSTTTTTTSCLAGIPIAGCIGDQQGALVGQFCLNAGEAKNTYGTGCFLLANVGTEVKQSTHGLLSTVGYKFGDGPTYYALEGSVAGAGSCVQWLRDQMGLIQNAAESMTEAAKVDSTEGVVFVPAFSGLLAPYWRPDARGMIIGVTQQTNKRHIIRAALEAVAFQVNNLIKAMDQDSASSEIHTLAVDGGMVANTLLMQMQADCSQIEVNVPAMLETTALGAAVCAGVAVNAWDLERMAQESKTTAVTKFTAQKTAEEVRPGKQRWEEAVKRTFGWADL